MRRRTLGALFAVSATALATLTLPSPARAEMVYRMATMGEPKTLDPHGVSGTWENYIVGDAVHGPAHRRRRRQADPGCGRELDDQRRRADLHLQDPRPQMVGRHAGHRRGLRLLAAAHPRPGDWRPSTRRCIYPIKNAEKHQHGQDHGPRRSSASEAIDAKTLEVTLENPTGYFLELLTHYTVVPGAQARDRASTAPDWVKPGNIVSNGAFTIIEWTPNARIVAEKNPEFYDAANVKIDKVIYYPDEDRNAVTKRFRAGEIDYVDDFASEQIDFLKRDLPEETQDLTRTSAPTTIRSI